MVDALDLREKPQAERMVMLVGWRQWADAGSISSGLPRYLIDRTSAHSIGSIKPDGFYLFQFPGTHDLIRPVVRYVDGFPKELEMPKNELYFTEIDDTGIIFLLGDEPHMDVQRYNQAILHAARELNVERIVGFGGVYAEVPYNKERRISCSYSHPDLRSDLEQIAVDYTNYHGGASIGSVLSYLAAAQKMQYVGMYAFVPNYDLSRFRALDNAIRLENDFMAWLAVMRRVNYLLNIDVDLADLESKSQHLVRLLDEKVRELEAQTPGSEVREYFDGLEAEFNEQAFDPLDEVWENELRRLLDEDSGDESSS